MTLNRICIFLGIIATSISFWLGSRFTADDAFITWRFGKNLVETGIWNYNPSTLDLTQAYTNPIYAILSITPPLLQIDVVLFFKIVSSVTLISFIIWFLRISKNSVIMLLLLLSLPATMIHVYGGLETFLFVFLLSILLVALDKKQNKIALISTLMLFLTRPESWTLVVLIPLFISVEFPENELSINSQAFFEFIKGIKINLKKFIKLFLLLGIPLAFYFLFHYVYFGNALPNTFYAKSGAVFSPKEFVKFLFFISPLFLLIPINKIKGFIFSLLFFIPISFSYSKSYLMMDYAARFAFHLFIPIYCYLTYVASSNDKNIFEAKIDTKILIKSTVNKVIKTILVAYMMFFALTSGIRAIGLFTYYPRLLDAHGELGKLLATISNKYKIDSFLIGDAGIAAYHSKLNVLDNAGLGSAKVIHGGVTPELIDSYKVDLVAFYATPESIQWSLFSQHFVHEWTKKNNFIYLCDLYWRKDYTFKIFTKKTYPEIINLCNQSKLINDKSDDLYFRDIMYKSPIEYWHQ